MKSFGGWEPSQIIDWKEKFEIEYDDDGQLTLVSKETFKHEDDDIPDFEYKYAIRCWDLYRFGSDEHTISIELFMVVLPQYWCKKKQEELAKQYDYINFDKIWFEDLIEYGVRVGDEYVNYNEDEDYYHILDNTEVVKVINICASVFHAIDKMRGFVLDRVWNMLGTTGWDVLREVLEDKDMILASIDRYKAVAVQ